MEAPSGEKIWRTDGIEPTYVLEDELRPDKSVHGWQLGGRFALEVTYLGDVVAWCEFVPRRSKSGTPMLATFHLYEFSTDGEFQVWKILTPGPDGQVLTEPVPHDRVRQYFDRSENLFGGDNASPVLVALTAEARARSEKRATEFQRQRDEDPYYGIRQEISDVLWELSEPEQREEGHRKLRALFDRLPREDVTELAIRIAYDYYDTADELYNLKEKLDEAD